MPPKKNTQVKELVKVEDVKDVKSTLESNSDEELEESQFKDDNSEEESDEDDSEDEVKVSEDKVKTKKQKETVEELYKKCELNESKTKELLTKMTELDKELHGLYRERLTLSKLLKKAHSDELNTVTKEKPKRKGNVSGGFNAITDVPQVLIKYLGLENDAKLSRPQVAKLLHQKFKDAGLKDGSQTTLNEKTVKELKLPKSYNNRVIKTIAKEEGDFTFQTFLKEFYPKKETSIQL
jgi:hypothetical protein